MVNLPIQDGDFPLRKLLKSGCHAFFIGFFLHWPMAFFSVAPKVDAGHLLIFTLGKLAAFALSALRRARPRGPAIPVMEVDQESAINGTWKI